MVRLALAIAAALILHILLLLIVLPERHIEEPEIKGTGQVTVSIIRPAVRALEQVVPEEPEVKEEKVQVEENVAEAKGIKPLDKKIEKQEKVSIEEELPVKELPRVSEKQQSQPVVEKKLAVPEELEEEVDVLSEDNSSYSSEEESLQNPQPISKSNRPPKYPALARKRGWEGTVILEVDIKSDGMVKDIRVQQSSKYKMLDKEALRAVSNWQFQPGSRGGKLVDMKVLVPVHFTLKDQ